MWLVADVAARYPPPRPQLCVSVYLSVYWHLPDCDCFCSAAPLSASVYTHTTKMDLPRRGRGAGPPHQRRRELQLETNLSEVWSFKIPNDYAKQAIIHSKYIDVKLGQQPKGHNGLWKDCESASRRFQPGEGPQGLMGDCTTSNFVKVRFKL